MGSNDPDGAPGSAAARSAAAAELPYQVSTGENIDDHTASAGITITSGGSVDSVRVRVPGMDEFETGPDQLRDWLHEHQLVRGPQEWTAIDQQIMDAIQNPHHSERPAGQYNWDDYDTHGRTDPTDPHVEAMNESQSHDWNSMLEAWNAFHANAEDVRSMADQDAESVIRQICHTITALDMIVSTGWAGYVEQEFAPWESMSADGLPTEAVHTAALAVADAAQRLYEHWHAVMDAGNYESAHMTDAQQQFLNECAQARETLGQHR